MLFGCWEGKYFRGNSKYLFLYFRDNYPNIQAVWTTKYYDLFVKLQNDGINVCYAYSIKGIILTLKAKYFIVTHGIRDVNEYFTRNGILINLEHTTYSIKSLLQDPPSENIKNKILKYLRNPYGYIVKPDYAITASIFTSFSTQTHYKIDDKYIIPLGKPKSDILLLNKNRVLNKFKDNECKKYYNEKMTRVLFLPTWRRDKNFSIFNSSFNLNEVCEFLKSSNVILGINFHPTTANKKITNDLKTCNYIRKFNSYGDEMNQLLSRTDILITDYSSLYADYLIYNKPLIFAKFNHEDYLEEIDLALKYDELPGKKVENWHELIEALNEIINLKVDTYEHSRELIIDNIYPNLDGRSRERIAKFITSI